MEYFLGIDIGTTSVKSVAFSKEGKTLCESSISYPIHHPFPEWSEQDPEEIVRALVKTVENILQELHPQVPVLCSFCSAMHSLIAVDKKGMAISPSIIWADNRAADISTLIHKENRAKVFYELTGLPVHAMSPFCKLLWLKENQKELFNRAYKFVGIKEYVFYKLFGVYAIDVSVASATGLLNAGKLQWDPWILEQVGISTDKLSEVIPIDKIFYSSGIFPILQKVPFVAGGSDGAMANIGSTEEPGSLVITIGTSSAARVILNRPYIDPAMRTFCYYIKNNQWLLGGASNNGGIVLQWLHENIFRSEKSVTDFLIQASDVKPGSEGLIFLPYLLGERAPIWNADAKGVLFGLQISHSQAAMVRASLEGIIYCIYGISQVIMEQSDIRNIYATGGFARNELGLQIMADVFNLPVLVCETVENSAWGAVKSGMVALKITASNDTVIRKKYFPNASVHPIYVKGFLKFQRLYELLKEEFI
ncbi:MAG TPA: gluconokinase [Puia sp.]|nr:gluconokinase [Puia sp.]